MQHTEILNVWLQPRIQSMILNRCDECFVVLTIIYRGAKNKKMLEVFDRRHPSRSMDKKWLVKTERNNQTAERKGNRQTSMIYFNIFISMKFLLFFQIFNTIRANHVASLLTHKSDTHRKLCINKTQKKNIWSSKLEETTH